MLMSIFSERSLYAIDRPSVVCRLSVTFVLPTQEVQIFDNISTALDTLAIHGGDFTEIVPGNPSAGGVKHKSGSQV